MKTRSCFVSNSSSSSFIIDAPDKDKAKDVLVECIAKFLDERETHERHVRLAEEFIANEMETGRLKLAELDEKMTHQELCRLTWQDYPRIDEKDNGKVLMVDYEHGCCITEGFASSDTWNEDVLRMEDIMKENGIERRM